MAGMLPGVESARRRRFHQGGSTSSSAGSRRPSFCLYNSILDPQLTSSLPARQRSSFIPGLYDGELGDVAREAKERLNERLGTQRSKEIKRQNSEILGAPEIINNVQREVYSMNKGGRKFSWSKMGWRASEQKECAVCLENFRIGDILMHLPCSHRFHWNCAMPWLESNSQCPCCRTAVSSSSSS